ncbi:YdbH domain-containing protein [Pseudoalteromonas sp. T1lg48]|uniref:YdbH domain-containing protein n=1 Tax=Pseudoalteromonas sp. T1lg48 TaxID=2077100 RepID=UPI000CF72024|nr:YdbH domain-containing protein [Pseudoalteromonas sp. T1lg48]
MLRKVFLILLGVILVLVIALTVAYGFRSELTHMLAKQYLQHQGASLTCARWQWGSQLLAIDAERLCLEYQGHSLTLEGVTLTPSSLHVARAHVQAGPITASDNKDKQASQWQPAPLALLLPLKRPLLSIADAKVSFADFSRPMTFAIEENQINHFQITGDIQGQWLLKSDAIEVDVAFARDFTKVLGEYIKTQQNHALDWHADVAQLALKGWFKGNSLDAILALHLDGELRTEPQCLWQLASQGQVHLQSEDMQQYRIAAQQLHTELGALSHCMSLDKYSAYLGELAQTRWQLSSGQPLKVNMSGEFVLPELSMANRAGQQSVLVEADNTQGNWQTLTLSSEYQLTAHLDGIGTVQSQGTLTEKQLQGHFLGQVALPPQHELEYQPLQVKGQFGYDYQGAGWLRGDVKTPALSYQDYRLKNLALSLDGTLARDGKVEAELTTKVAALNSPQLKVRTLAQQYHISANPFAAGERQAQAEVQSQLGDIELEGVRLSGLKLDSSLSLSRVIEGTHIASWQGAEALLKHNWSDNAHALSVVINDTELHTFMPLVQQLEPELVFGGGTASLHLEGDALLERFDWQLDVNSADVLYQNYLAQSLTMTPKGSLNSGVLQLDRTKFNLSEVRAGPVLKEVHGTLGMDEDLYISKVQGKIFDGTFALDQLYVTGLEKERVPTLLKLEGIRAENVLALEPQQGISVKGLLAAELPVRFNEQGVSIENGRIYSQAAGKLTIDNNAAFNVVKEQQQQLGPMLAMLENLDINSIHADVDLTHDGWLTMAMQLKGENPEHQQAVNFNYNHQENIYTLFRALRLSDEITKRVEQEYQAKE